MNAIQEVNAAPSQKFELHPGTLHEQLDCIRCQRKLAVNELAEMAGVSWQAMSDVIDGKGLFAVLCRALKVLDLAIDLRSWDYQRIMSLSDSTDHALVCAALTKHYKVRSNCGRIPKRDETAVYWAELNRLRARSVAKYLRFICVSARVVSIK